MTRQLWKVRRQVELYFQGDEAKWGNRWLVTSPTGVRWGTYATHTEALEHADIQSRTVTLKLPREDTARIGRNKSASVRATANGGTRITFSDAQADTLHIFMKTKRLKPLALALLAHHYKETA